MQSFLFRFMMADFFFTIPSMTTEFFHFAMQIYWSQASFSVQALKWAKLRLSDSQIEKSLRKTFFAICYFVLMLPAKAVRRLCQAQLWMWKRYTFGIAFFLITKMLPKKDSSMKLTYLEMLVLRKKDRFLSIVNLKILTFGLRFYFQCHLNGVSCLCASIDPWSTCFWWRSLFFKRAQQFFILNSIT